MRKLAQFSMFAAALAFSGCAAEAGVDGDHEGEDFVASEAEAIKASDLYKALTGSYKSSTAVQTFTLDADGNFTLDTGIRCFAPPCDEAGDAGKWSLWTYRGRLYLNLTGKSSRWYHVSSYAKGVLVGMTDKGTWQKQAKVEEPVSGCAAILCAPGNICVDDGTGAKCITACATVRCASNTYCDASSGAAQCVALVCPKESFINCMPPVSAERAKYCSGTYHEWIETNCATEFVY